jgi:transposase
MKKQYTKEFKLEALKLAEQLGSVAEATRQLGLTPNSVHNWKAKYKYTFAKDSAARAVASPEAEEIKRLKKENEELKKVNYILKRAAAFFSQDHLK